MKLSTDELSCSLEHAKVCSFDVFDTLLFRRTGPPEAVFVTMAAGWKLRFGCEAPPWFVQVRSGAEARVRAWQESDIVTFDQIYRDVVFQLGPESPTSDELMAYELETEERALRPCPEGTALLARCRSEGKLIVFLSDMYLPPEFIRQRLASYGLLQDGDRLYVSGSVRSSKASGALYRHVQQDLGASGDSIFHVGDSTAVDVEAARRQGWPAATLNSAALTRREHVLWHLAWQGRGLDARVAGAARAARLRVGAQCGGEDAAVALGTAVAGPLLVAYAAWVLAEARQLGLEELFFLSRDAQVVFEICKVLSSVDDRPAPRLTYLYGSRQVWAFHALRCRAFEEQADFFADHLAHSSDSFESCLALLGLQAHPGLSVWRQQHRGEFSGRLLRDQRHAIYRCLQSDPESGPLLQQHLAEQDTLYLDYLRGLPIRRNAAAGLVDIGWSGRWTHILAGMFELVAGIRPLGFQMGRVAKLRADSDTGIRCFMFDQALGTGLPDVPGWFVPLMEAFCGADHGRTQSMERTEAGIRAVPSSCRFSGIPESTFRAFRLGVVLFSEEWVAGSERRNAPPGTREALIQVCQALWDFPSGAEANFVGSVHVGLSPAEDNDRQLCRPYQWSDFTRLLTTTYLPGFEPHWWHNGSLALSPPSLRAAMFSMQSAVQTAKQLVRDPAALRGCLKPCRFKEALKRLRWIAAPSR
jgi:FMN phosphatase YigB (HAD superfamily)